MSRWTYKLPLRLRSLFRRKRVEQELTDELRFHLGKLIDEKVAKAMTPEEARYAALRELGGLEQIKEECRDMRRVNYIENLLQDVRYGLRQLRRNPGFTAVAVITLALGIGANTAMFSVVNAVILRPLPYMDPDHLVWVTVTESISHWGSAQVWRPDFAAWREQGRVFDQIAAFDHGRGFNLTGGSEPARVQAMHVTPDIFLLLGAAPARGRIFLPEEIQPGRNHVAILSHSLWQSHFGSDPLIVGKSIVLDRTGYTVIGVMSHAFNFPYAGKFDIWLPLPEDRQSERPGTSVNLIGVIARLKPGTTVKRAEADLEAITRRLDQQYPKAMGAYNSKQRVKVVLLHEQLVSQARRGLFILLGVVGFVLLIACVNFANLLLARGTARQTELAIRTALGASRPRLIAQLLTESTFLAILGGTLGLLIVTWSADAFKTLVPETIHPDLGIDLRVLSFTLGISFLTGMTFGLVPAFAATRSNLNEAFTEGRLRLSGTSARYWLGSVLVVSELGLSLVLLVGAGLLTRSFVRLLDVPPGFDPGHLLTAEVNLPFISSVIADGHRQAAFFGEILEKVKALPGVKSAALTTHPPLREFDRLDSGINVEGHPPLERSVSVSSVSPDYFRTMGIRFLKGRDFTEQDSEGTPSVVLVNETFARLAFQNQDALGRRIGGRLPPELTIVGVVSDVRNLDLDKDVWPEVYYPYPQMPSPFMTLVIRSASHPRGLAVAVKREVMAVDKDQPVFDIETMEQRLSASTAPRRFRMMSMGAFAGLAVMLAAIGIYGVTSYSVTQRTHEIGIRMALGSTRAQALKLVLGQGFVLMLWGVGVGLAGALCLTRFLADFLFGVHRHDPATLLAASVMLTGVAAFASYIPARRATKVDPMVALRYE